MMKKKCAIYCRVSTNLQDYQRQIEELTSYCNRNSYDIKYIFKEKISGASTNRPEFDKMCQLDRSDIQYVLVLELSRLSRSMSGLIKTIEDFANKGISILSLKENFQSLDQDGNMTPSTIMMLGVGSAMVSIERQTIKERMTSGKKHKIMTGETAYTSKVPFGYTKDGKKIVIDNQDAEKVKTIFNLYLNGRKIDEISVIMNMGKTTIHYILKNIAYTGIKHSNITETNIELPKIIDKKDYDEVQSIMKGNRLITKKSVNNHSLKGKLYCGVCGYLMSKHGGDKRPTWVCQCGCNSMQFNISEKATEIALEATKKLFGYDTTKKAIEAHIKALVRQTADMSELVDNLYDKIEEEKKKLEVLKDVFSTEQLKREVNNIKILERERDKQDMILQGIFKEIDNESKSLEDKVIDESVIDKIVVIKKDNTTKVLEYHIYNRVIRVLVDYSNRKNMKIEVI